MRFGSLMSPHHQATAAPLYLPHPHSLCLFLPGILIKSADLIAIGLVLTNTHTSTHIQGSLSYFSPAPLLYRMFICLLTPLTVCAERPWLPSNNNTKCVCVCVYMLAHMDGCLLRAEGFVYSVESHTYTH